MAGDVREHWAVLLWLRAMARLRDMLITAVVTTVVFVCIVIVAGSVLAGVDISDGFRYVGEIFARQLPVFSQVVVYFGRGSVMLLIGFVELAALYLAVTWVMKWLRSNQWVKTVRFLENAFAVLVAAGVICGLVYAVIWQWPEVKNVGMGLGAFVLYVLVLQGVWVLGRAVKKQLGMPVRGEEFEPK